MLECFEYQTGASGPVPLQLELVYQDRQRSRCRATTRCGREVAWFIERGVVLADGDVLLAQSGERIAVIAAPETLSVVECDDPLLLARAAYHLGNRHVPLQIAEGGLRYQHDHVLDDMIRGLGLTVYCDDRPFHPENGAYHSHAGGHSHGHGHSHSHDHSHGHAHG